MLVTPLRTRESKLLSPIGHVNQSGSTTVASIVLHGQAWIVYGQHADALRFA